MTAITDTQLILSTLRGSNVTNANGLRVVDAFSESFKEYLPYKEDEEGNSVQMTPDELSNEQKGAVFLAALRKIVKRQVRANAERVEQAVQDSGRDDAIKTAGDTAEAGL